MHREVISPYGAIVNIGANRTLASIRGVTTSLTMFRRGGIQCSGTLCGQENKKGIYMRLKTIDPE